MDQPTKDQPKIHGFFMTFHALSVLHRSGILCQTAHLPFQIFRTYSILFLYRHSIMQHVNIVIYPIHQTIFCDLKTSK